MTWGCYGRGFFHDTFSISGFTQCAFVGDLPHGSPAISYNQKLGQEPRHKPFILVWLGNWVPKKNTQFFIVYASISHLLVYEILSSYIRPITTLVSTLHSFLSYQSQNGCYSLVLNHNYPLISHRTCGKPYQWPWSVQDTPDHQQLRRRVSPCSRGDVLFLLQSQNHPL